jgi:hypothetical protein
MSNPTSSRSMLLVLMAAGVMACDPGAAALEGDDMPDAVGGKADQLDPATAVQIEVAQAGIFDDGDTRKPTAIHYGFTNDHAQGWEAAGELEIVYDEDGRNAPVVIDVPEDVDAELLAFVFRFGDAAFTGQESWTTDQFIPIESPEGTIVQLPIHNGAGYPFSPECYGINVEGVGYDGFVETVLFAFTDRTREEYDANNDVPWFDVLENPGSEGIIDPIHRHDGGYKGTVRMLTEWVRVPAGMNLVYKLDISKHWGYCITSNDTALRERTYTQTYFVSAE